MKIRVLVISLNCEMDIHDAMQGRTNSNGDVLAPSNNYKVETQQKTPNLISNSVLYS